MEGKILIKKTKEDIAFHYFCRKNNDAKEELYEILKNDYIAYKNENNESFFSKRENLKEIWDIKKLGIKNFNDIYYKIEESKKKAKKLVIIFNSMPDGPRYAMSDIDQRMFTKNFYKIKRSLTRDTMVLRIADINLIVGSFYKSTSNFKDYEEKIQDLINEIITNYKIKREKVVLIGGSKGATGALIHGKALNLKVIASDPILNMKKYINSSNDVAMLKEEFFDLDLISELNSIKNERKNIQIFCSENVKETYEEILKLENVNIINNKNPKIKNHPDVTTLSYSKIKQKVRKATRKNFFN